MKHWLLPLLLLTASCQDREEGPVRVSAIGGAPAITDPNKSAMRLSSRLLLDATSGGLVAYDENGQIRPALAERWIVTSDGLSAIFRLRRANWTNGKPITSADVARRINAMLAPGSRNPLREAFDSIAEINPTTPEVIEFRLTTPRPPLLELLAQPEAAMLSRGRSAPGELAATRRDGDSVTLTARRSDEAEPRMRPVELRGERSARAIARFLSGGSDLVLGGTFVDWPMLQTVQPPRRTLRIDPADGLFGLSFLRAAGFLGQSDNRQALAMAIDRDALLRAFEAPGWAGALPVLPRRFRSAADPALPAWTSLDLAGRIAGARERVARWPNAAASPPHVRVWLPEGPGGTLVFARLLIDWRRIGVQAVRSNLAEADVRLVDEVAAADSALWYLSALVCPAPVACSEEGKAGLVRARRATSLQERGEALAAADRALAESGLYIPLARPLRWSLVSPRLTRFRENARAWHPLDRLVQPSR